MNDTFRRLRRICSALRHSPEVPVPPPDLPSGRVLYLPGRGETFVRLSHPDSDRSVEGLPVLLLHGWTASADLTWFATYPALAARHRVVALDHRGHGRGLRAESPFSLEACADDAAAVLDLLGAEPAIVVGYSMGGAIALLMRERHPEAVAGLVLSGAALEWRTSLCERLLWQSVTLVDLALRMGSGDGFVQRYLREAIVGAPEVAELRAWVGGEVKRGYSRDVAAAGRALSVFDGRSLAASAGVPSATVVTTRDRLVRPKKQWELATALSGEVFTVDGDHDAPLVKAKEFAAAISDAVAAVDAAAQRVTPPEAPAPMSQGRR